MQTCNCGTNVGSHRWDCEEHEHTTECVGITVNCRGFRYCMEGELVTNEELYALLVTD